jgi:MFS family permease
MVGFGAVFPLLNLWIRDLGISHTQAGLLSGFWYLPGVIISLPAGWLFDRYSIQRILIACWVLILAGTALMMVAPSFWVLCAGRLIFSIGMNAHMIGTPKLVGQTFAGRRELGFVMGIYTMSFTAEVFIALNVLGSIGSAQGWRPAMQLVTGMSALGLVMVAFLPKAEPAPAAAARQFNPLALGTGAWLLATAYFGYSIGTEALLTFGPDALVTRGIDLATASATVGFYAVVALILKPILSSQLRAETALMFVVIAVALAIVVAAIFFVPGLPLKLAPSILGVSFALGMPALIALPSFLFPPERSGQCYGLYQTLYSLGFLAQPAVGLTVDRTGSYPAGFLVIIGYCLLGLLVLAPQVRKLRA